MEQRARNTLELFFQNLCQNRYLITRDNQADISIIDMDAAQAHDIYHKHREIYPDRPTLLVSLMEIQPEHGNELFLAKPIQPEQLLDSLEELRGKLHNGTSLAEPFQSGTESMQNGSGQRPVRPPPPPVLDVVAPPPRRKRERPKAALDGAGTENPDPVGTTGEIVPLFPPSRTPEQMAPRAGDSELSRLEKEKQKTSFLYVPDDYLQGYIQQAYRIARREERNVSLEGPWRPIVLLPESREIWVEQSHSHLYALSNMAIRSEDVTVTCLEPGWSPPEQGGSLLPIDQFLWKLAVRTARGRIPAGTDLRAPVYLHHWPNLSRLLPVQHGLCIAALWTRHPVSLMEAATILNIPPKYLFSFYSAASAIGLIGHKARSEGDHEPPSPSLPRQHEHRGLFRKILSRLRGRGR
ncbi:MAG TPA: hypothetical protein ENJ43_07140 [Gammaproteobacteria bacterium]|nr:hypothetical protein [Gammaproteobacteria bacterium]